MPDKIVLGNHVAEKRGDAQLANARDIELHRKLCERLEAVAALLRTAGEVSAEEFLRTIEVMTMTEQLYTAEQMKQFEEAGKRVGPEEIRAVEEAWGALLSEVRANRESNPEAVGVKALQGILNYQDAPGWSAYDAGAVTGHEDVVFFGTAVALAIVMAVLGVRTKLFYVLLALQPVLLTALLLDQRRTGFIALAVVLVVVAVLLIFARPKRGLLLAAVAGVAALSYIGLFWDASGPLAEPVRAVRSVVDPSSVSARDQSSSAWRQIENRNIAFTIQHLPLTGVGLGEKYLVHVQPPPLYDFIYWQYITHNALLWLWLKAGPIAAFALWTVIARALLVGSAIFVRGRDRRVRWIAALPVALVVSQILFSAVDLGLTYSRSMLVLGSVLGLLTYLADRATVGEPRPATAIGAAA